MRLPVGFHFMDDGPQPGDSGALEVQAVSSRGQRFGIQDPDVPSYFSVDAYTDETLRFEAVAHVCEGSTAELVGGENQALCEMLERRTYRVEGAVSFPTARNSVARLQNSETDAYLAYRDLRLDALLGPGNSGDLPDDPCQSSPGNGGGAGPVRPGPETTAATAPAPDVSTTPKSAASCCAPKSGRSASEKSGVPVSAR